MASPENARPLDKLSDDDAIAILIAELRRNPKDGVSTGDSAEAWKIPGTYDIMQELASRTPEGMGFLRYQQRIARIQRGTIVEQVIGAIRRCFPSLKK